MDQSCHSVNVYGLQLKKYENGQNICLPAMLQRIRFLSEVSVRKHCISQRAFPSRCQTVSDVIAREVERSVVIK